MDADGQSIQVPSISEDGTVVFETAGKYTIEYTAVNPNNEAKSVTKTFTLTVTLKNDEDPKPEDPKPEDPKPEDPKPEGPKPEEPQELQEGSETAETDSKNQEEDDQIVSEDLEDVQKESQNSPADLENPQQEGQDSPEDLEDLQVNLKNL